MRISSLCRAISMAFAVFRPLVSGRQIDVSWIVAPVTTGTRFDMQRCAAEMGQFGASQGVLGKIRNATTWNRLVLRQTQLEILT
jgi:hypothetical protein